MSDLLATALGIAEVLAASAAVTLACRWWLGRVDQLD